MRIAAGKVMLRGFRRAPDITFRVAASSRSSMTGFSPF
jgi:hypothetical protein